MHAYEFAEFLVQVTDKKSAIDSSYCIQLKYVK